MPLIEELSGRCGNETKRNTGIRVLHFARECLIASESGVVTEIDVSSCDGLTETRLGSVRRVRLVDTAG